MIKKRCVKHLRFSFIQRMFYQRIVLRETFSPFRSAKKVLILFRCSLQQRTCEANPAGENSSFIFTVGVKSVPLYHFMLAYVVLHTAVKEFFESHFCNVSVNSKRYQPPSDLWAFDQKSCSRGRALSTQIVLGTTRG